MSDPFLSLMLLLGVMGFWCPVLYVLNEVTQRCVHDFFSTSTRPRRVIPVLFWATVTAAAMLSVLGISGYLAFSADAATENVMLKMIAGVLLIVCFLLVMAILSRNVFSTWGEQDEQERKAKRFHPLTPPAPW